MQAFLKNIFSFFSLAFPAFIITLNWQSLPEVLLNLSMNFPSQRGGKSTNFFVSAKLFLKKICFFFTCLAMC
jgi:uncharacterized membrane protein